jgi:FAD dependent oxidoreductase
MSSNDGASLAFRQRLATLLRVLEPGFVVRAGNRLRHEIQSAVRRVRARIPGGWEGRCDLMQRYLLFDFAWRALRGNTGWQPAWREPRLKAGYDVVVIGGGGHGLATAYYLARKHGVRIGPVLERGWIAGGNRGRNTQFIRFNYFNPVRSSFCDYSLRFYKSLWADLNFDVMCTE